MFRLGIDLGGTKTEGILLDGSNIINRKRVPTPHNYDEIISIVTALVDELSCDVSDFTIGICTPGVISKTTNVIKNSNTACLVGKPFRHDLEAKLGKTISVENDANCFAIAEATMGSAKEFSTVFGVIMGTGVGGGIVIDGKIHRGRLNIAGEWGHHILRPGGNPCYCGKNGCVETYLSGPALEKKWLEITGKSQMMPEIVQNLDSDIGEKFKCEWLENFGLGLANVIDILDPDAIVLGGGLSNIDFFYTEGIQYVSRNVFSDVIDTPILRNKLGDSAGVFGAALLI